MNLSTTRSMAALGAVLIAIGCGGGGSSTTSGDAAPSIVRVDGSSTVFLISEAVAEEFKKSHSGVRVTVGESGTGGGFQKFCRGETDISDASRPIKPTELETCKAAGVSFIELPIAYDGIALVTNPKASWINDLTVAELKTIWAPESQGKITRWSQVRSGWPDRELHLFGAGVSSGTYDYFTEAINGKEGASRGDFTSSEDDNVLVQGVSGDELALGFIPVGYYSQNKERLKLIPVDNKKPDDGDGPIGPNPETIRTGTYQPLSRPLFIYVAEKSLSRPEVSQFVEFYLANAATLAEEVGYVQLGQQTYALVTEHFKAKRTGSLFATGGSQVGVTIEQLLAKEQAR